MSRRVLACISRQDYRRFLAGALEARRPGFDLRLIDPAAGVEALAAELNASATPVLITGWSTPPLPADLMAHAPSLRYICHLTGTLRGKIPRELIAGGLLVTNWGGAIARVVAEHCVLQILSALRRSTHWQLTMHRDRGWSAGGYEGVLSLFGRSVGIHGLGAIGRGLCRLLRPWHCPISSYTPSVPDEIFRRLRVRRCDSVEELFSGNQIIVELLPLIPENVGVVDEHLLRLIPPDGVFVNSGRGAVVDEQALAAVAKEGRLRVALDVFADEPLPQDSPLRGLSNVFLTPHVAGPTLDRQPDCGAFAVRNIRVFFRGRRPDAVVDLEVYDRQT
ncbi:MAG: hydroxyacid dehydrogenase [Lentisphaerae bacterium]|nr:hydroxyacid dehydrogenase [Lentisphaerota bacterium]